eukprot:TRINITY_DN12110_c0_g1_i1.p1 TRINITY_DN12110_c0_g1~~TRINITY_DN12110_c0_g1_i1.p1  ORF type:complete len:624 (+),score=153.14 TRINITY_DN12110_c0_g1_i1:88-1959(+)
MVGVNGRQQQAMQARGNPTTTAGISQEVLHLVKAQRRVRGTVAVVDQGGCMIDSAYGSFPFDPRSVKANKNHPDRKPEVGDPCEFRLSHHIPPTAVSIRVAVPKVKRQGGSEDIPIDVKYRKSVAEYLDLHCTHAAPIIAKVDVESLKLPLTLLHLSMKAVDEVENCVSLDASTRQRILLDFGSILETGMVPPELSSISFFKQFKLIPAGLRGLPEPHRSIIKKAVVTRGEGLAEFIGKEIVTLVDFTDYNTIVGGKMMEAVAELIEAHIGRKIDIKNAVEMGLLVEKTSAIKGFLDHVDTPRGSNWPKDVWGHHFDTFGQIAVPSSRTQALDRLNLIITDVFNHAAHGIEFLAQIADSPVAFCFLAVPCVLALSQLSKLWGNPQVFSAPVGINQTVAANIIGLDKPRDAVAWINSIIGEMHETFRSENYDPVSYKMLIQIESVRSALRRVDAAVAAYGYGRAEERSLTRALLAEQGAALGGKLLYNMIDTLGSVFHSESYSPYSAGPEPTPTVPSTPVSEHSELSTGTMGFLTGIARGWLGLDSSLPLRTQSTISTTTAAASENFASFYEGCHYLADDASSQASSTSSPVSLSSDEITRKRSLSLKAQGHAITTAAMRSKTP